jgi:hypothetical protein
MTSEQIILPSATTGQTQDQVERDPTEDLRRTLLVQVNTAASERAALEAQHGQVWDTQELARDFVVEGFMAPFVVVKRKADGAVGSLMFQHNPRFYFDWSQDS